MFYNRAIENYLKNTNINGMLITKSYVSGESILIEEKSNSLTSFIYYNDEVKRDKDFGELIKIQNKMKVTNLKGNISQITLHGQLAFIESETYFINKTKSKDIILVKGVFLIIEDQKTIEAEIEFVEKDLDNYHD